MKIMKSVALSMEPFWHRLKRHLILPVIISTLVLLNGYAQDYQIVYDFSTTTGPKWPDGSLILSGATLYGTTSRIGSTDSGTVFKINTDGSGFTELRRFSGNDGWSPRAGLVLAGTTLFGTASMGGTPAKGTVFKLNTDGSGFVVLKSFTGEDGWFPETGLLLAENTLYGTTEQGGMSGSGVVFKLNTDGTGFVVLKHFDGVNGKGPRSELVLSGATLYGTTFWGGTAGYGTVFQIHTDGTGFAVIKEFVGGTEGSNPKGHLVLAGTTLYGTTAWGGSPGWGAGTVYKVNCDGSEFAVLKRFNPSTDGEISGGAGITHSGTRLFGTASDGGASLHGTAFTLNMDGTGFTVLKSFDGIDGANPMSALLVSGSTLYGTTHQGGNPTGPVYDGGGVVFSMSLCPPTVLESPVNQDVIVNSMVDLAVRASGLGALSYQWLFNLTNAVMWATNSVLHLGEAHFADTGLYSVIVTNIFGAVTSAPAQLHVLKAEPNIFDSPASQTREAGSTLRFVVSATGAPPLGYRWFFNGDNITDAWATDQELNLTNVQPAQSGAYSVIVTNSVGAATSAPAMLNVIAPVPRRPVLALNLTGEVGNALHVEYTEDLNHPSWLTLETIWLNNRSQWCFDLSTQLPPQRFYRAWQIETPGVMPVLTLPGMIPALTLTGSVGTKVRVDGINQIGPTDAWFTLDTVTLTNTTQLYFDTTTIGRPPRLYRLMPVP